MCFPPIDQANPFAYSRSFALYTSYTNDMFDQKGQAVKMLKTNYYRSLLVTIFVQTCSLISIYNGMYTVCSYDIPQ